MKSLRRFLTRLLNSAARRAQEERLREEIEEHIALQTAENLRAGLSPGEARRQAMLKFGGGPHLAINRSEEHTSELQSHSDLVCRLLLEKKKTNIKHKTTHHSI